MTFGLEADSLAGHERFVAQVLESELVWGLRSEAGWANCPSNSAPGSSVMPFWSKRAGALRCASDGWERYHPESIPLFEFMIAWLYGMEGEGVIVGTNWNRQLIGHELLPKDLNTQLIQRLSDSRFEAYKAELDEKG
tara:strand:+ start:47 stop:457 length:411 start_codon:yes stop_codon:yes gene_type:complete